MPLFSTSFTPPGALEGFNVEAVLEESVVRLTWQATSLEPEDFGGYRVYRSTDGGATFELLGLITDPATANHDDYEGPLNTSLTYRVTQANLDFESDPVEGTVSLSTLAWWAVTPNDESLTFAITKVRQAILSRPKVQETYAPMGRTTRVVVGDVVQTEEGSVTFLVMPDNVGMHALLRAIQARMDGALILKAPDGAIHFVQYGSITRSLTAVPGMQELTLPFAGV